MRSFLLGVCLLCFVDLWGQTRVFVLGIAQDGGFPHIGCMAMCRQAYQEPEMKRFVVSLAVTDEKSGKWWLFEATPDFRDQLHYFQELTDGHYAYLPEGIVITHAHMGHYTGLAHLGKEALAASGVPVYVLPKMADFLRENGPWSQLVQAGNIDLRVMARHQVVPLSESLRLVPFPVPHRDEYSETAGFRIQDAARTILFIPDIDKWERWDEDIVAWVEGVDLAFLDGSFFQDGELPNRNAADVPHPFVTETIERFSQAPASIANRVHFIHLNHTNPLLWDDDLIRELEQRGFHVAVQGAIY
ncbi:MAG: MBL fold metallo-hydrolase [Cyclobacteriaceae bacterium]|nr:MBL fold metallo-hydrolase [Cyclobacteriaceae bacterium]